MLSRWNMTGIEGGRTHTLQLAPTRAFYQAATVKRSEQNGNGLYHEPPHARPRIWLGHLEDVKPES